MAIPGSVAGYGNNSTAQNVWQLTYSQDLSSQPQWEAYDGGSFPAVGVAVTTANTIFAGTAGNGNIPMMSLVATSSAPPISAWKPGAATAGSANPNRMKGAVNYVTDPTTPTAGQSIRWNMVVEVPSDATTGSTMAADILNRYTYSGTAPVLTWAFNDVGAGGNEGLPVWTTFVPGTNGLRHTRSGVVGGGPYYANIPATGTEDTVMGWVTT